MVDWDQVDKRRARGWEWDRIADDPKVGFHAEEGAGEPGRALRALYYQRRSKGRRTPGDADRPDRGNGEGERRAYSRLAWVGFLLVPLVGIWFLLALVLPSIVGTYFAAIPWIGILLAGSALVLAYGLLSSIERWNKAFRTAVIVGIVLGFCVSGGLAALAVEQGCPVLTASTTGEPGFGWEKASNPMWAENGAPVFFFFGSIACPYCSASSWAVYYGLSPFGQISGTTQGHSDSNPSDIPDTPEIVLAGATMVSQYVALHVDESTDDSTITTPATPSCVDQAYVSSYDSTGSIPFVVVGGIYVHVGTLADPTQLRATPGDATSAPDTFADVQGQMVNNSGPAWNAISPQMYYIEALLLKLNHGQGPSGVVSNQIVQTDLKQIS